MRPKRCMFNHNDCIREECVLYYENCCFFHKMCVRICGYFDVADNHKNKAEFSAYMNKTFYYEIILDIVDGKDVLEESAKGLFVDFLYDNGVGDGEIDGYLARYKHIPLYLFIYKNAVRKLGLDDKQAISRYCFAKVNDREKSKEKRLKERQAVEKKERREKLIASIGGFIKHLESIKAKKVLKKDLQHYYRGLKDFDLSTYFGEDEFILRYIADNNLYGPKKTT